MFKERATWASIKTAICALRLCVCVSVCAEESILFIHNNQQKVHNVYMYDFGGLYSQYVNAGLAYRLNI